MQTSNEDALSQLHQEYIQQISESGIPLWVHNEYSLPPYTVEEEARVPKNTYYLIWSDNFTKRHETIVEAIDMAEAMNFVDNQARQFGYNTCNFISVSRYEHDPDHPLPQDTWNGDLPF